MKNEPSAEKEFIPIVKKEDSVEKDADPIEKEGSVGKD